MHSNFFYCVYTGSVRASIPAINLRETEQVQAGKWGKLLRDFGNWFGSDWSVTQGKVQTTGA